MHCALKLDYIKVQSVFLFLTWVQHSTVVSTVASQMFCGLIWQGFAHSPSVQVFSSFLPHTKDVHARLNGDSYVGHRCMSMTGCLLTLLPTDRDKLQLSSEFWIMMVNNVGRQNNLKNMTQNWPGDFYWSVWQKLQAGWRSVRSSVMYHLAAWSAWCSLHSPPGEQRQKTGEGGV